MAIENTLKKALETAPTPEPVAAGLEPVIPAKRTFLWMPRVLSDRYSAPAWRGRKRLRAGVREQADSEVVATHRECVKCGRPLRFAKGEIEKGTIKHYCSRECRKGSK